MGWFTRGFSILGCVGARRMRLLAHATHPSLKFINIHHCVDNKMESGQIHIREMHNPTASRWVHAACKAIDCIECEQRKVRAVVTRMKGWLADAPSLKYRLFTFSNKNETLLPAAVGSLKESWRSFTKYVGKVEDHPWKQTSRWVRWMEVTEGDRGFNAHYHVIVGANRRLDWARLHGYWDMASGAVSQMNVGDEVDGDIIAGYIASYASKRGVFWGGLSAPTMRQYGLTLQRQKRVSWSRGTAPRSIVRGPTYFCCSDPNGCSDCSGSGSDPLPPDQAGAMVPK